MSISLADLARPALAAAAVGLAAGGLACGGESNGNGAAVTEDPTPLGACGTPLPPLTDDPLTAERFEEASAGLDETIVQAEQDAPQEALVAFFLLSHDLTHDVDAPLREQDGALAIRLCNAVLQLEELVGQETDGETVAELARSTRDLLSETQDALSVQ